MSAAPLLRPGPARALAPPLDAVASRPALPESLRLFGLEFSLDTASLDALENVARSITRETVRAGFPRWPGTEEVALLSTCHRVELVLLARSDEEIDRWREVLPGHRTAWRIREGRSVVDHVFRVAAGLESLARGEGEVRHQVRAAAHRVESRHPRPVLRELFRAAADAADRIAPAVPAGRSIAAVAAARLLDISAVPSPRVLVIGSGSVGRQVAESLAPRARVTIVFHQNPPPAGFLRSTGARAEPLARLAEELARSDAAVTAAKFGHRGVYATDIPQDHRIVLVDLGVPRNIDPGVRLLPNVRLIDLEELRTGPGVVASRDGLDAPVDEAAGRTFDRLERRLREPWIDSFRRGAEEVRRSELENARPFLGRLDADQQVAVERLTRRLVARLLGPPTERMRALPPGPDGDLRRRLALELLEPLPRDP